MRFKDHSKYQDKHAFLSPSKYHWVNYSPERLRSSYLNYLAVERGTRLHKLAKDLIDNRQNLPRSNKTLNLYVNDAIGYRMETEQTLVYSDNCFGTADAICFRDNTLRIHDLKTGKTKASFVQLEVYAALFFLEYSECKLANTDIELRIYQANGVEVYEPEREVIQRIMNQIVLADKEIEKLKEGV